MSVVVVFTVTCYDQTTAEHVRSKLPSLDNIVTIQGVLGVSFLYHQPTKQGETRE